MNKLEQKLDEFYREVYQTILVRQDPLTGLFPASTDINEHGDYTDAWVRDNVYTIQAVWGLALAYRRSAVNNSRAYMLEQSVVKLMRGLLMAMIRQSHKVETFKFTQNPMDALHAKYDTQSGTTVVGDDQWGHLQLDATAIFLLMIAQMTKAGLRIIFNGDEVNFVQNLVHYIGRAYRTPDFGIWERGNKINNGAAEVNASSVGMAKAALEAMNKLNLYGDDGDESSVINVMADEIARSRSTLYSLLPRESYSKEVDSAVLSIIGYPAFAIEDEKIVNKTRKKIIDKLGGNYGCKRFLLDGHQTVMEDEHRLHYEMEELKNFANIESEWPLFFTYLMLDAVFRGDATETKKYRKKLEELTVEKDGLKLLPELYFVPFENVEAEKAKPKSQERVANNNLPLIWAQSLFLLGRMIDDKVLSVDDLDPLKRHERIGKDFESTLQVCIISENKDIQKELEQSGITSTALEDLDDLKIMYPNQLASTLSKLGANEKLGLSGRPRRRMRALATARIYNVNGQKALFLPQVQNRQDFYLELDNRILIEEMKTEFSYITRHWDENGEPIQAILITPDMLSCSESKNLIDFIHKIQNNKIKNTAFTSFEKAIENADIKYLTNVDNLPEFCPTLGAHVEQSYLLNFSEKATKKIAVDALSKIEEMPNDVVLINELSETPNLYRQIQIIQSLLTRHGLETEIQLTGHSEKVSISSLLEEIYQRSCDLHLWAIVRSSAALLHKSHYGLADALTELIVRQKIVIVGRAYNSVGKITASESNKEILKRIKSCCGNDEREELIHQEMLIFLSYIVKSEPKTFKNMISIRTSEFIHLIDSQIANELGITHGEAFDLLTSMSPEAILKRLQNILHAYQQTKESMSNMESLAAENANVTFKSVKAPTDYMDKPQMQDWAKWRVKCGSINQMPKGFYEKMLNLLKHCQGIILGDKFNSSNQINSQLVLSSMTAGEPAFAYIFEALLNDIPAPDYRYLTLECLLTMASFFEANPDVKVKDYLVIDVLVGHAVRLNWLEKHPAQEQNYGEKKAYAWENFYQSSPKRVASGMIKSLEFLLQDS